MIKARASKSFAEQRQPNSCSDGALSPFGSGRRSGQRPDASTRRRGHSALTWLNRVCLDAPIVAVSWQWLFAYSFGISISRGSASALFLTAWLIYLMDRFGDSLSIRDGSPTSLRQRFAVRHRSVWLAVMVLIAAADLVVTTTMVEARTLRVGAVVGVFALAYLVLNRTTPMLWRRVPVKEITIGFLFAAGVMVPLVGQPAILLSPGWFLFACLCSLNCICIAVWERELDEAQDRISIATTFPRGAARSVAALALIGLTSLGFAFQQTQERWLYLCLTLSALFLGAVHLLRNAIDSDLRTALADLVLLTPLLAIALT